MKKLAMIAALTFASSAFASIHLTVRSDYISTPSWTDNTGTGQSSSSLFTPSFARLYLNGKVGDADIKTGLDIRSFTQTTDKSGQVTPTMTVDKFVHFLYFDKPMFTDGFRFQAGKLEINQGGWEHDQIEAGDSYLNSLAAGGLGATNTMGGWTLSTGHVVATPGNASGAGVSYAINDTNTVAFQVANQVNQFTNINTGGAGTNIATSERNTMGLHYTGWFLDKSLGVKAGYMNGAGDATLATGSLHSNTQYIDAGVKYSMSNWFATLDYLQNTEKTSTNGVSNPDNTTTSTVLSAYYTWNTYRPLIKYEHSENKYAANTSGVDSFKRDAFNVGVEFLTSDTLRWQLVYVNAKDTAGQSGVSNVNWSQYVAGLKWDTDFLK